MPKIPYSIKIDEALLSDLKKVAEKEHRSVNNAIEMSVKEYTEKHLKDV